MKNKTTVHQLITQATRQLINLFTRNLSTRQLINLSTCLLLISSCDDGDIYSEKVHTTEGRSVTMIGNLSGCSRWTDDYKLALAGFGEDEEYAEITKYITAEGQASVKLSGIGSNVKDVRLCVIDRLRRHVLTFASMNIEHVNDSTTMDVGTQNVSMYDAIQQKVFNASCVNCHGAATSAAAGLFLTADRSYNALVGKPSARLPQYSLVAPGNANGSVLRMVINTDTTHTWHYDHSKDVTSADIKSMIDNWINEGAER